MSAVTTVTPLHDKFKGRAWYILGCNDSVSFRFRNVICLICVNLYFISDKLAESRKEADKLYKDLTSQQFRKLLDIKKDEDSSSFSSSTSIQLTKVKTCILLLSSLVPLYSLPRCKLETYSQTYRQTYSQTCRQTYRQTYIQTKKLHQHSGQNI